MKVYCPYCKKEVEYKIEQRELKEFRGIEVNTFENVAICNECNQDLYVNKIEDENNERIETTPGRIIFNEAVRKSVLS